MTRDNLIQAIYDNGDTWSCPSYNCDFPEIEGNESAFCIMCADRQLAEYEAKIRADAMEEVVNKLGDILESAYCQEDLYNYWVELGGEEE